VEGLSIAPTVVLTFPHTQIAAVIGLEILPQGFGKIDKLLTQSQTVDRRYSWL
jgi:hypothetical protein